MQFDLFDIPETSYPLVGLLSRGMHPNVEQLLQRNNILIAGVDEAGRGPLVGSVVTSAVILGEDHGIEGLADSKKLSEKKRNKLFEEIKEKALAYCICEATAQEIDQLNILQATLLAMKRVVEYLPIQATEAWIDGNKAPNVSIPCHTFVKGDALYECISAGSILAKVTRDQQLTELDLLYPEYGFAQHKGYPTVQHLQAIAEFGVIAEHRTSYKPVREQLEKQHI